MWKQRSTSHSPMNWNSYEFQDIEFSLFSQTWLGQKFLNSRERVHLYKKTNHSHLISIKIIQKQVNNRVAIIIQLAVMNEINA